jgi:hypothetical protein
MFVDPRQTMIKRTRPIAHDTKSADQEQRSDGDTKPSGNKKSSKQKKNKGSGGNSNKTAYATDLSDSGYADV